MIKTSLYLVVVCVVALLVVVMLHPGGGRVVGAAAAVPQDHQVPVEETSSLRNRKLSDTTNPDQPVGTGCFSAVASVHVLGKGAVRMKDLQIGDKVLSTSATKTKQSYYYQTIYAFLHRKEESEATFLRLETTTDLSTKQQPLEITHDHLVYLHGKMLPVPAGSIVVGDILQTGGPGPATVTKITRITRQDGEYAPLTPDGTIIVDGIKVSTYVVLPALKDHAILGFLDNIAFLQHFTLSPFRFYCGLFPQKHNDAAYYSSSFLNEQGLPPMVSFLKDFGSWIVRQESFVIQVLSMIGYGIIASIFWILESSCLPFLLVDSSSSSFSSFWVLTIAVVLLTMARSVAVQQQQPRKNNNSKIVFKKSV